MWSAPKPAQTLSLRQLHLCGPQYSLPASQLCFFTNSRLHPHLIPTPTLTSPGLVGGTHTPQSAGQTFLCIPALACRLTLTWALKPTELGSVPSPGVSTAPQHSAQPPTSLCALAPSPFLKAPRTHSLPMPGACHLAPPQESLSCLGGPKTSAIEEIFTPKAVPSFSS